jgi:radical SAM superfamily enzyme YgiQ (UPF0313 family)
MFDKLDLSEEVDVLLIAIGDQISDGRQAIPLGIAVLKGVLVQKGFRVKCLDNFLLKLTSDQIITVLDKLKPKIVGLSSTAYYVENLVRMTRYIKSVSIEIPVIIGGYCSLVKDLVMKTQANAVCNGEGDETIVELVDHFMKPFDTWGEDLNKINGISFISTNESGEKLMVRTPNRPLIQDLDSLPFPDFSDFNPYDYSKNNWVPFYSQRGCYNNCEFCDIIPFYGEQRIRSMSPKRFVEWLEIQYKEHNFQYFIMNDDNFMSTKTFLMEIYKEIKRVGLLNKVWLNFQTRINDIIRFKDIFNTLQSIIFSIELGIESFADSQLKRYKKNTTKSQNLESIKILTDLNIPFEIYYMFLDKHTTFSELEENITTILSLPPVPYHDISKPIPELVVNYQYNVWSNIVGESTIANIDFLEVFEYFLEETEEIKKAFILFRSLKQLEEMVNNNEVVLSEFQSNLLMGMGNTLFNYTVDLGIERLKTALDLCKLSFKGKMSFKQGKNRKLNKLIVKFNAKVQELLSPFFKLGVDFQELEQNF